MRKKKLIDGSLPDKLSDLLWLAISDLRACAGDDNYRIAMCNWHVSFSDACYVCMAGSIMANSLQCDIQRNFAPDNFTLDTRAKLYAVNCMRKGNFSYCLPHRINTTDKMKLMQVELLYSKMCFLFWHYPHTEHRQDQWFTAWGKIITEMKRLKL